MDVIGKRNLPFLFVIICISIDTKMTLWYNNANFYGGFIMNNKKVLELKKRAAILGSTLLMLTNLSACTLSNQNDVNSDKSAQTSSKELDDDYAYLVIFNGSQATYFRIKQMVPNGNHYEFFNTDGATIIIREATYFSNDKYVIVTGPNAEEVAKKMVEDLDYDGPSLSK